MHSVKSTMAAIGIVRRGRPPKAAPFRHRIEAMLREEPSLTSREVLERLRAEGYAGGKSALYEFVARLRSVDVHGLPDESVLEHDVGTVPARFTDGHWHVTHFVCSRDPSSRAVAIILLDDWSHSSILQALATHHRMLPQPASHIRFVNPIAVAEVWREDGSVIRWKQPFSAVLADLDMTAVVSPQGRAMRCATWIQRAFFGSRSFRDRDDLNQELDLFRRALRRPDLGRLATG